MHLTLITSLLQRLLPLQYTAAFTVTLVILLLCASDLYAQRITYESLRMRDRDARVFSEQLVIPDTSSHESTLVSLFRIQNNFLSFRRYRDRDDPESRRNFYAEPDVNVRVFKGASDGDSQSDRDAVKTVRWNETVFAETYEQASSPLEFVQNMITTSLEPGTYRIETTTTAGGRTRRGLESRFKIADTSDSHIAYFYFLDDENSLEAPFDTPLANMGNNVFYGRDHNLGIWFPEATDDAGYELDITRVRISGSDTTDREKMMEYSINQEEIRKGYLPEIYMNDDRPYFRLEKPEKTADIGSFYVLKIPNSTFQNAHYRIRLKKTDADGQEHTIASRTYQNYWLDMPKSLLNLDVAINMMEYIADDSEMRSLRRGSREDRERRFREFWAERDPSPDREYNELMVEYYRRIDYAYDNFTTPQKPGYESDQGKVYIRNGEPDRKERTFPPNQATREVWHYGDKQFVFEATTGFGDFRLIEQR